MTAGRWAGRLMVLVALVFSSACPQDSPTQVAQPSPSASMTPSPSASATPPERVARDPTIVEVHRIGEVPKPCRDDVNIRRHFARSGGRLAHLDADRRRDLVYYRYQRGAILGICLDDGTKDELRTGGMAETLVVFDLQPDGRHEIFYGGNTAVLNFNSIAVVRGGRIHPLPFEDGREAVFVTGRGAASKNFYRSWSAIGCEDVAGGHARELVYVTVTRRYRSATEARWRKVGLAIHGRVLVEVFTDSGRPSLASPRDFYSDDLVPWPDSSCPYTF